MTRAASAAAYATPAETPTPATTGQYLVTLDILLSPNSPELFPPLTRSLKNFPERLKGIII
jgi:hypothetical protein